MQKIKKLLFVIVIFGTLAAPALTIAAESTLVFCNKTVDANGLFVGPKCGWPELMDLVNRGIKYIILLSVPIAAIAFAYAGFLIMSAGGNAGQVKRAREIFQDVLVGLFFILAAWAIVNTILTALTGGGYSLLR